MSNLIGGDFAGVQAAWQAASRPPPALFVKLYEMRPVRFNTPAHLIASRTEPFAEIFVQFR